LVDEWQQAEDCRYVFLPRIHRGSILALTRPHGWGRKTLPSSFCDARLWHDGRGSLTYRASFCRCLSIDTRPPAPRRERSAPTRAVTWGARCLLVCYRPVALTWWVWMTDAERVFRGAWSQRSELLRRFHRRPQKHDTVQIRYQRCLLRRSSR
jgi:hypothetical protein